MTTLAIENIREELGFAIDYDWALSQVTTMLASQTMPIRFDIPSAVATAMGVVPKLKAIREQLAEHVPTFDVANFDNLRRYAAALAYANARYLAATAPPAMLPALHETAMQLRDLFYSDIVTLAKHGVLGIECLPKERFGNGYKNVSTDLTTLVSIFKDNWAKIQGKLPMDEAKLIEAEVVARQLLEAAGAKEQAPDVVVEVAENRVKLYTRFVTCYTQVRRAVRYVCWDRDDIDDIAPSLFAGRGGSAHKPLTESADFEPVAPSDASAVVTETVPSNGVNKAKIPVGMPGADPFVDR